jgi:DNA-binding transcriptional ArsR family regulator
MPMPALSRPANADGDSPAAVLDALGAPRRRQILRLVWDRERSAGDIARACPEVSFGAVSQHLSVLESAGLVARRDEGRFHYYAARRKDLGLLGRWLEQMWDQALADLKRFAEAEAEAETEAETHAGSRTSPAKGGRRHPAEPVRRRRSRTSRR